MQTTTQPELVDQGNGPPTNGAPPKAAALSIENTPRIPLWRRIVNGLVLVVILAVLGGFGSYLLGVQVPGLAAHAKDTEEKKKDEPTSDGVSLVKGKPHTLEVPEDVRTVLGIRKGNRDLLAVARAPTTMRPLM